MPFERGRAPTSSAYDVRQQRECAVFEFHGNALERIHCGSDIEKLENDRLVFSEHLATSNTEQKAVADLTGSTGDSYANGGLHGGSSTGTSG
jgi:hypothetical protein